jgi:phosphoenolpyruvate carboxylase
MTDSDKNLLKEIAAISRDKYLSLKNHPKLVDYLATVSPIKYYSDTNIGSRPANRSAKSAFELKDLRAIPYVGAWAQLKQNVTGYYGVGTALKKIEEAGKWDQIVQLYKSSLFVKTLIDNCEMSMKKCFFPLTAVLAQDEEFGEIWNDIYQEYEQSKKYVLALSGNKELMADYPVEQLSVSMREKIVLPLTTIQQYALANLRKPNNDELTDVRTVLEKLVIRCSFGIINAGRNSA